MHSWLITWITQSKKWRRLELIYKDTWKGKFPVIDQNLDMKQMKIVLFMVAPMSSKEHKSESDYKDQNKNGQ